MITATSAAGTVMITILMMTGSWCAGARIAQITERMRWMIREKIRKSLVDYVRKHYPEDFISESIKVEYETISVDTVVAKTKVPYEVCKDYRSSRDYFRQVTTQEFIRALDPYITTEEYEELIGEERSKVYEIRLKVLKKSLQK